MGHSYAVHAPMRPNTGEGEKRKEGKRLEKRRACELGRGRSVSQSQVLPRVNDSELLRTSASTVHTHIAVYNAKVTRIKTENYSQCKRYIIADRPTLIAARCAMHPVILVPAQQSVTVSTALQWQRCRAPTVTCVGRRRRRTWSDAGRSR